MDKRLASFRRLLDIMDDLRERCPWDRKQTFRSLSILTIEEVYELVDALSEENMQDIEEEVGDLLLHMVFYAKIGQEKKAFDITSILERLCDKLVERHPHIYGDVQAETEAEVKKNWETIKLRTSPNKTSLLSGVPRSLPAMVKAYRIQDKTAQVGFEWKDVRGAWEKLKEEIKEYEEALEVGDEEASIEEFGDILFSMVNVARYQNIDPEAALERVNKKFIRRFQWMEKKAEKPLEQLSLQEMDRLWNSAKGKTDGHKK